jgi:hypothetical protein
LCKDHLAEFFFPVFRVHESSPLMGVVSSR